MSCRIRVRIKQSSFRLMEQFITSYWSQQVTRRFPKHHPQNNPNWARFLSLSLSLDSCAWIQTPALLSVSPSSSCVQVYVCQCVWEVRVWPLDLQKQLTLSSGLFPSDRRNLRGEELRDEVTWSMQITFKRQLKQSLIGGPGETSWAKIGSTANIRNHKKAQKRRMKVTNSSLSTPPNSLVQMHLM